MRSFFKKYKKQSNSKEKSGSFILSQAGKVAESSNVIIPGDDSVPKVEKINSFNTIFNKDHSQIKAVQRVFKKSILFLSISLVFFALVAFSSINIFEISILLTAIFFFLYITTTIIFLLIVAEKIYVWLSLLAHLILVILVQSFVDQVNSPIVWAALVLIGVLYYFAYSEIEKAQLGSRLFSIHQVSLEATNILVTIGLIVTSIGIFGTIFNTGSIKFIEEQVLDNQVVFTELVMGDNRNLSVNQFILRNDEFFGKNNIENTFEDFLIYNYKGGVPIILNSEEVDIVLDCQFEKGIDGDCGNAVLDERNKRLQAHAVEDYSDIDIKLEEVLDKEKYEDVVKQYYQYRLREVFDSSEGSDSALESISATIPQWLLISKDAIFPALLAIIFLVIGMAVRSLLSYISLLCTWVLWTLLKAIKFIKISIETVESEVVTI